MNSLARVVRYAALALSIAACGGGSTPVEPPPPPTPTVTGVTLSVTPQAGMAGDSARVDCTATTSNGSSANISTNPAGQYVEIRPGAAVSCTATLGASSLSDSKQLNAQSLNPQITVQDNVNVQPQTIGVSAASVVDSSFVYNNGGLVGKIMGSAGSVPYTPVEGANNISVTSFNNRYSENASRTVMATSPANTRLIALDVATNPNQRLTAPNFRYDLIIDGVVRNLPRDTTLKMSKGSHEFKVNPTSTLIEPIVGFYKTNDTMIGASDVVTAHTMNIAGDTTMNVDVIQTGKPEFSGATKAKILEIYTEQGDSANTYRIIRPKIAHFDIWVQRTPITLPDGQLYGQSMPAGKLAEMFSGIQQAIAEEPDSFGRSFTTYTVKQEQPPDSIYTRRTISFGGGPLLFAPRAGNVIVGFNFVFQGSANYSIQGEFDSYSANGPDSAVISDELTDLIDGTFSNNEDNSNTSLTRHNKNSGPLNRTSAENMWRTGPLRIGTQYHRLTGNFLRFNR
jgi:hypothetical protein